MGYRYYICDVFTKKRFGGNQLAVLPDAAGLDGEKMQQIAREFNFSETTFVLPPEQGGDRRVRIFTPTKELPFAGHPNVGTAFVLADIGELGAPRSEGVVQFEELAGIVPVSYAPTNEGSLFLELKAPEQFSTGNTGDVALVAEALSLDEGDIITANHQPIVASVGVPFPIVELASLEALQRIKLNFDGFEKLQSQIGVPDIFVYVKSNDDFDLHCRMFAPFDGIVEDPATGSANGSLAGLLASLEKEDTRDFEWKSAQGVEMGRPSALHLRARKIDGQVESIWVGGSCVMVAEGEIEV